MKNFLSTILFTLLFSASLFAIPVTISSVQIPNWTHGGTTAKLQIVSNQSFFNSNGVQILRGSAATLSFYKDITCTVSVNTVTCPSFTIDSTTDSSVPAATYTAYLYDAKNIKRAEYLANFKVPHTFGSTMNWLAIATYSKTLARPLPSTYYTADQINQLIDAGAGVGEPGPPGATGAIGPPGPVGPGGTVNDATTSVAGKVTISAGGTTTVVSVTDKRYLADRETKLVSEYSSFSNAISTIGSTADTVLEVPTLTSITASVTVPANVRLKITGTGGFNISTGVVLTITNGLGLDAPKDKYIFQGAGSVAFTNGYPETMYAEWYGGRADSTISAAVGTDNLSAFSKLQLSMQSLDSTGRYGGGKVQLTIGGKYYFSSTLDIRRPLKLAGGTSEAGASSVVFRFPPNTTGIRLLHNNQLGNGLEYTLGAEISGIHLISTFGGNNAKVNVSGTLGNISLTLLGTGTITNVQQQPVGVGDTRLVAGSTVNVNGFPYIVRDTLSTTAATTTIPVVTPRFWAGKKAGTTNTIVMAETLFSGMFPAGHWAGAKIIADTPLGEEEYTIASNTTTDIVLTTNLSANVNGGGFYAKVMGATASNVDARINNYPGIEIGDHVILNNIAVSGFAGNGYLVYSGSLLANTYTNTNLGVYNKLASYDVDGSGIVFFGQDSTAIAINDFNSTRAHGVGIFASSNLGSTFNRWHTAYNFQGDASFYGGGISEDSVTNPYTEPAQPPTILGSSTNWLGGITNSFDKNLGFVGNLSVVGGVVNTQGGFRFSRPINKRGDPTFNNNRAFFIQMGESFRPHTLMSFGAAEDTNNYGNLTYPNSPAYVFTYDQSARGWYSFSYAQNSQVAGIDASVLAMSGSPAVEGSANLWLPRGSYFGFGGARRKWEFIASTPSQLFTEVNNLSWTNGATATGTVPLGFLTTTTGTANPISRTVTTGIPDPFVATADSATERITKTNHGITGQTTVTFTVSGGGTLPAPLIVGTEYQTVDYGNPNYFGLYDGINLRDLTSNGTPTITVNPKSPRMVSPGHGFASGTFGQFTTTGTLPTGLALSTTYYLFDANYNGFKVAASFANYQAGIGITFTNAGSGAHTFVPSPAAVVPFGAVGIANGLTATATLNFTSMAANSTADATISVPGANVGDVCHFSTSTFLEAGIGNGGCTIGSANVATVRLLNVTAGAIDPASASFKVWAIR